MWISSITAREEVECRKKQDGMLSGSEVSFTFKTDKFSNTIYTENNYNGYDVYTR